MVEILTKREQICKRLGISKEVFYKMASLPGSPIKQIAGTWFLNMEELSEFVRKAPRGEGFIHGNHKKD